MDGLGVRRRWKQEAHGGCPGRQAPGSGLGWRQREGRPGPERIYGTGWLTAAQTWDQVKDMVKVTLADLELGGLKGIRIDNG